MSFGKFTLEQIGITVGIGQSPAILGLVDFCYVDIGTNVIDYFPDDFSQLKSSYLAPENGGNESS